MKLRIVEDSIRLRLAQSEVARLAAGETLEVRACTKPIALTCTLNVRDQSAIAATFRDGCLAIEVPAHLAKPWATSDDVGIDGRSGNLRVLIEKDFKCLHGDGDDPATQADCFPNPRG